MSPAVAKQWVVAPASPERERAMARALGISPVVARVLVNRGVCDAEAARAFFHVTLNDLHEPAGLPDMEAAAVRIRQAVQRREKVVVYGDYDADGISATALLLQCLSLVGLPAEFYLPHRIDEGYGLNLNAMKGFAREGVQLVVTVDCGVNAHEEAAFAREAGIDLIITDHHEPGPERPPALCVVNPKLKCSSYPFRELAGAGVAFKLCWAIARSFSPERKVSSEFREFLVDATALAALGTIADVVPLVGENRAIAKFGLDAIRHSEHPGLRALRESSDVDARPLTAHDVAFRIGPRLNAAGRMGTARRAVELLTTDSLNEARQIADELNRENGRRQRVQQKVLQQALKMVESEGGVGDRRGLVLAGEGWHPGVIGIVASRLADELCRPVILVALDEDASRGAADDVGHGSGRSVPGFNLFEAVRSCGERLVSFGGHEQAIGLRVARTDIPDFRRCFQMVAGERLTEHGLRPTLSIDVEAPLASVTRTLVREMDQLEPFGQENPQPLLSSNGLNVVGQVRRMGAQGRHLSFRVRQGRAAMRAVAFGMGDLAETLDRLDGPCDLAYVPQINSWRGRDDVELMVKDIRFG